MADPIIKKNSAKFDTAHNIETHADIANKTAEVFNLVTGEQYLGGGGGGGGDLEYSTWEVVINCPAIADEYMTASNTTKDTDSDTLISGAPIANNKIYNYLTIPVTDGLTNFSQKFAVFATIGPGDNPLEIQMNEQIGYTASASGDVTFEADPDAGWIFIVTGNGTITITANEPL